MEDRLKFRAFYQGKMYDVRSINYDTCSKSFAQIALAENELTTQSDYLYIPIEELTYLCIKCTGFEDRTCDGKLGVKTKLIGTLKKVLQ